MGWIVLVIFLAGWLYGLSGLFKKAGIESWKAWVPFYNYWYVVEKCQVKKIWFWLLFVPIVGQFVAIWLTIIFVMNFGRFSLADHAAVVFIPFLYLPWLAQQKQVRWTGPSMVKLHKKSGMREWLDAAVFAVVAATIIRTFFFEAYVIPTGSMEKTLRINDFLFVNKLVYGSRMPMTPLAFPLVHNTMPRSATMPSYLKWVQLPYYRLPAYGKIERNDVVVFNFPAGDTIINLEGYGSAQPYYDVMRNLVFLKPEAIEDYKAGMRDNAMFTQYPNRQILYKTLVDNDILWVHPVDKTDNYIKRCIGLPGDEIVIRHRAVYINGKLNPPAEFAQTDYEVKTNGTQLEEAFLRKDLNLWLTEDDNLELFKSTDSLYLVTTNVAGMEKLKKQPNVLAVTPVEREDPAFPYDSLHRWNTDNFGPLLIPRKGTVITLGPDNINIYRRAITNYEGNRLEEKDGQYFINGVAAKTYTFKQDYYWMMGDNRHRSQDSRFWGFVPETHIVGKASLVWFSWENGPRWGRIFRSIK
jgi:signal peptidase I